MLVQELSASKAVPPLVLGAVLVEEEVTETGGALLTELDKVGTELVRLLAVLGGGEETSEGEAAVSGESELLKGNLEKHLVTGSLVGHLGGLLDAVGNVQGHVHKNTVSSSLDLKVTEENVGLEVRQDLIKNIILGGGVGRALVLGTKGQDGASTHCGRIVVTK